jgi:hypothetical protein
MVWQPSEFQSRALWILIFWCKNKIARDLLELRAKFIAILSYNLRQFNLCKLGIRAGLFKQFYEAQLCEK